MIRIGSSSCLSNDTAVSGSVTGCVAQKPKPPRLKIWSCLTSFPALMAGKLNETTVQYTWLEFIVIDMCTELNYSYQKTCSEIFTVSLNYVYRLCAVQQSRVTICLAWRMPPHRGSRKCGDMQQNLSVFGRRGIMAFSPGLFPNAFLPIVFLVTAFRNVAMANSSEVQGAGTSCWFQCWG